MKTNYVLVDFENVQPDNLELLKGGKFKIRMFVGAKQKISVGMAIALHAFGEDADYVQMHGNGKNALDFHIAYYVGKLAAKSPDAFFHIISKDTGFDPLVGHLNERKIFCKRSDSISEIPLLNGRTHSAATPVTEPKRAVAESAALGVIPRKTPTGPLVIPTVSVKPAAQPTAIKAVPAPKPKPVAAVLKHLAKSTKPRKEKTLRSAIKGVLGTEAKDQQISDVIKELLKRGIVTITDGKISNYKLPT